MCSYHFQYFDLKTNLAGQLHRFFSDFSRVLYLARLLSDCIPFFFFFQFFKTGKKNIYQIILSTEIKT